MAFNNVTGSTATTLKAPGVYTITSTVSADKTWLLGNPTEGAEVQVFVDTRSTKVVTIGCASSAQTMFGSTANDLAISTGQGCVSLRLTGISTSVWAHTFASKSTAAPFTGVASTR